MIGTCQASVKLTDAYSLPLLFMARYLPENRPLMATIPTSTAVISRIPQNRIRRCVIAQIEFFEIHLHGCLPEECDLTATICSHKKQGNHVNEIIII